jgi:hypothetical protein
VRVIDRIGFSDSATSRAGAVGLWQFMPAPRAITTCRSTLGRRALGLDESNACRRGVLQQFMQRYNGNIELSVASYNTGRAT